MTGFVCIENPPLDKALTKYLLRKEEIAEGAIKEKYGFKKGI